MRLNSKKYIIPAVASLLFSATSFAATTPAPAPAAKPDHGETLLYCLVGLMIILLFVIGMLANTVRQLSFVIKDRLRDNAKSGGNVAKTLLLLIALGIPAAHSFAANATGAAAKAAAPVSNTVAGIPANDFYAITGVIILELIIVFALTFYVRVLLRIINNKLSEAPGAQPAVKRSWFWDSFNAAVPMEKEKDLLLDHDYDGIQELDNSLPPWWKYGFYLTIVVACIYLYRYHISHEGPSSHDEFVTAMKQAEQDKAAYLAQSGNLVDENNVTQLKDPADIAAGKDIFVKTCAPCHLPDGGGVVGPNLTDDYWIHGGSIKDVFKSIKYGWQDKGMKPWKDDFSPKQIQQLASFVKSLKGTRPATPKAPQGDLYIEASAAPQADSAKAKTDTAKAGKVAGK